MAQADFRVNSQSGMWLRTQPVVSDETKIVLLPNGQLVTKLGDSEKPDWWQISTNFQGANLNGFSNSKLLVPDSQSPPSPAADLISKTLTVLGQVAPRARPNYLQAVREGGALFAQHGITTSLRMAHLLAQAMQETGSFTVLRESMNY